jgi:hypothetical protein
MKTDDLENELRHLKLMHLSEIELAAYDDRQLDQIGRARAEAHLKQCFICARQLELLREESAALSHRARTADDEAFVRRLMEQARLAQGPSAPDAAQITREAGWRERLAASLQQLVASWQITFRPVRGGHQSREARRWPSEEVWRWQSEDGHLRARATMEESTDLLVHFSSNEMAMEGARLQFRLGSLSQELTLRRISESEVAAQVAIPRRYRQSHSITAISIEIL